MKQREAKKLGRTGGRATLAKYGPEQYRKIARKRWAKVRKARNHHA